MTAPTAEELINATAQRIPHYAYQFKPWNELTGFDLEDTVDEEPTYTAGKHGFTCSTSLAPKINKLKSKFPGQLDEIQPTQDNESAPNSEVKEPLKLMPHPYSDCRHVDPGHDSASFRNEFTQLMAKFTAVETQAKGDGELNARFREARASLSDADTLLNNNGSAPKGMQRLRYIFNWTLGQVTAVFGEINAALDDKDDKRYKAATTAYVDLLRDLDDHEPHIGPKPPSPGESGYGRVVKWSYIAPLIHEGRIKGAIVVAKWNPHISSSGIPIPHD